VRFLLAAVLLTARAASAAGARPNIVVVDICSARADAFGAYGGPKGLTPGLDAFAAESTVFMDAWAQSSWCLPNYATLLTGHRPEVHGLDADIPFRALAASEETIAMRLTRAGYRTGAFSSGVHALPVWGLDRGFETYENHYSTDEALAGRFADEVPELEAWIARDRSRPFFLYATVDDLHTPYQPGPDASAEVLAVDTETVSVGFYRAYNGETPPPGSPLAAKLAAFRKDPASLARVRRRYDAALRATDRAVSRFLSDLKARGLWDTTIVVVTADHGELLGEHGLLGHTEGLYQGILGVPLFLRDPRRPRAAGAKVRALVERVDLAPTVLDAAGADASGLELQGRSLLPLLDDAKTPWRAISYASNKRQLGPSTDWDIDERAVRDARWKLMWSVAKGRWELYDLQDDPRETKDLAAARPDEVSRLSFELMRETERARTHAQGSPSGRPAAGN
jgi:arylsulfatase A-like enzyme